MRTSNDHIFQDNQVDVEFDSLKSFSSFTLPNDLSLNENFVIETIFAYYSSPILILYLINSYITITEQN